MMVKGLILELELIIVVAALSIGDLYLDDTNTD